MFTVEQIENAHGKVQSGSDFPSYIREIKSWVYNLSKPG